MPHTSAFELAKRVAPNLHRQFRNLGPIWCWGLTLVRNLEEALLPGAMRFFVAVFPSDVLFIVIKYEVPVCNLLECGNVSLHQDTATLSNYQFNSALRVATQFWKHALPLATAL